jgi:hypothetical protein
VPEDRRHGRKLTVRYEPDKRGTLVGSTPARGRSSQVISRVASTAPGRQRGTPRMAAIS